MYELKLQHQFASAHQLKDYIGECKNLHGHTWKVDIMIQMEKLVECNGAMVVDFKELKKLIDEKFDHKFINNMVNYNPTAENISKDIYEMVDKLMENSGGARDIKITLWENDNASITYSE